jgi:hypothetical protein
MRGPRVDCLGRDRRLPVSTDDRRASGYDQPDGRHRPVAGVRQAHGRDRIGHGSRVGLARPNAALLALSVIGVAALARPSSGVRLRWPLVLGAGGIVVLTVVLLTRLSGNYGLGTLFYHAVVAYLPHPALGAPALPWSEVLRLYTFRTVQLATSPVPLFALLGVLVL